MTQTGHPIICSHTIDWVPAFQCEMFNRFCCFVFFFFMQVLFFSFVSKVLEHYNRNLNAAFIKYIKICNVTKPFSLHMKFNTAFTWKKKRWLLF